MSVLVLGPFDSSGYGTSSSDYALALHAAGADVVCRRLRLDPRPYDPPAPLKALLARPHRPYDACLQVLLPHQTRGHADLPTAGLFFWETDHFRTSSWARHLDRLRAVVVPAANTRDACRRSGVTAPLHEVPVPVDVRRYERSYDPLPALAGLRRGAFVFYTVAEFVRRKALNELVTAYLTEFRPGEPVHLVVKTHRAGVAPAEFSATFVGWFDKLLSSLRLHADPNRYPRVTLVNQHLTDHEVLRLHASCDCYVSASRGEGWDRPAFDAMALGRTPVVPDHTGYSAWADNSVGWVCRSRDTPCQGAVDSFADLYRGDELWRQPDVLDLRRRMREAYEDASARRAKARAGTARAYQYSHEAIGPRLLEVLAACRRSDGPTSATRT